MQIIIGPVIVAYSCTIPFRANWGEDPIKDPVPPMFEAYAVHKTKYKWYNSGINLNNISLLQEVARFCFLHSESNQVSLVSNQTRITTNLCTS